MFGRAKASGYEYETEGFRDWMRKKSINPRGIPPSVVKAEIATPGSAGVHVVLSEQANVITVIPRKQ